MSKVSSIVDYHQPDTIDGFLLVLAPSLCWKLCNSRQIQKNMPILLRKQILGPDVPGHSWRSEYGKSKDFVKEGKNCFF
jgi:hypothetical protein